MESIIVAIICNVVMALILLSGVLSAMGNGVRVTLIKAGLTIAGGVGAYFLTPVVGSGLYGVEGMGLLIDAVGISEVTINSCIFLILFLAFYAITLMVCSIVKTILIKKLKDKNPISKLKLKRARSINPRAERIAKKRTWKALKAKYSEKRRWYHKVTSGVVGAMIAVIVSYVVIMPYGYIAHDINKNQDKNYLVEGYGNTLNGLIGEEASDFLVDANTETSVDSSEVVTE